MGCRCEEDVRRMEDNERERGREREREREIVERIGVTLNESDNMYKALLTVVDVLSWLSSSMEDLFSFIKICFCPSSLG